MAQDEYLQFRHSKDKRRRDSGEKYQDSSKHRLNNIIKNNMTVLLK